MSNDNVPIESLSDNPIPDLIKKIRSTNNLTQASFGKLFKPPVTQPTVARWEKGEQTPDRIHFPKIASFLNLTFEEFLRLIEAPQERTSDLKIENKTLTPNKRHLSILSRGVKGWNRWRIKNPDVIPDLAGVDSLAQDLEEINLSYANLRGAKLHGNNLSRAILVSANLSKTNLNDVNLSNADLRGANMSKATLISNYFIETNLQRANLSEAILKNSNLSNANLEEANLSYADLSCTDLRNANLNNANLEYAKLVSSYVYGVSTWDIKVKGAIQKKLYICPWKGFHTYVDDIRLAYIKSLEIVQSEDSEISSVFKNLQLVFKEQNQSFEDLFGKNKRKGENNEDRS